MTERASDLDRLRTRVGQQAAGQAVDGYLAGRFRYLDHAGWLAEIAAGRVLVDGQRASPQQRLRLGQELCYLRVQQEPWVDDRIRVVHEDAAVLAVAKPAHLPMHADGPFVRSTLVQLLRDRRREPDLGLVHRLDRETSGIALLARTDAARKQLQAQFEAGEVAKEYLAIVAGECPDAWTVDAPIGHANDSRITLRRSCAPGAVAPKAATTRFERVRTAYGRSLVRAWPATGRTHQIRVHLAHSGHPILGDKIYGQDDSRYLDFVAAVKRTGDPRACARDGEPDRHLLHAVALRCEHPTQGGTLALACPPDAEFLRWIDGDAAPNP
jgi:23S rRNA pseudouridine1911/1915/1917 synthase